MAKKDDLLYGHSESARGWQNTLNCAIILKKTHRFDGDKTWGKIMGRLRVNKLTKKDREIINSRVIKETTILQSGTDLKIGTDMFRYTDHLEKRQQQPYRS